MNRISDRMVYNAISIALLSSFLGIGCPEIRTITRSGNEMDNHIKQECLFVFSRVFKSNLPSVQRGNITSIDKDSAKCISYGAFKNLKNEACELGTNLIAISNMRMLDRGSSCGLGDAFFYKVDIYCKTEEVIRKEAIEKNV